MAPIGMPVGEQQRLPLLVAPRQEDLLERRDEACRGSAPGRRWCDSADRRASSGRPMARAEDLPELLAAHGEREVARLGAEGLVRQERLVGGAHGLRDARRRRGSAPTMLAEQRELALQHRHVDGLAAAGPLLDAEREHDAVGRVHPRRHVGDGDAAAHAVPARLAGDADHPALGLQDQVERGAVAVRPVLAEARDGAVDDAGVPRRAPPRSRGRAGRARPRGSSRARRRTAP